MTCRTWDLNIAFPREMKRLQEEGGPGSDTYPSVFHRWINVKDAYGTAILGDGAAGQTLELDALVTGLGLQMEGRLNSARDTAVNVGRVFAELWGHGFRAFRIVNAAAAKIPVGMTLGWEAPGGGEAGGGVAAAAAAAAACEYGVRWRGKRTRVRVGRLLWPYMYISARLCMCACVCTRKYV